MFTSRKPLGFSLYLCVLLSGVISAQQAPGGVEKPLLWYAEADVVSTIGNYHSFDLLQLAETHLLDSELPGSSTLFFVLKPSRDGATEAFLNIDGIQLFGDRIEHHGQVIELEYVEGEPCIVSLQVQRPVSYARRRLQGAEVFDPALFDIAELIAFPRILSREELRKVNSYLALKYSITITQNEHAQWRDYWMPNNAHYWDTRIDRLYDHRVLGLGRSDKEGFYQTQTISSSGDEVRVSLGEVLAPGEMPESDLEDESFIIFSEKERSNANWGSCDNRVRNVHPLENWKFQLQNWGSTETELFIRVKAADKSLLSDSLFLFDGQVVEYLPLVNSNIEFWTYSVSLNTLLSFRHYFFTTDPTIECEDISVEVIDDQIVVQNRASQEWDFEVQSLQDGFTTLDRISDEKATRYIGSGQYVVSIINPADGSRVQRIVSVNPGQSLDPTAGPDIRIFPNPVESGQTATLLVSGLPSSESLDITVTDAAGRIWTTGKVNYEETVERPIVLVTPGLYTVIIRQGTTIYTLKHIVAFK